MLTEEKSGRKQESLAEAQTGCRRLSLLTVCVATTLEPKSEPKEDVRDLKDVQHGLKVLRSNFNVCVLG